MSKQLVDDLERNPQMMDYVRYWWLGDIISGDFLSYERPYAKALHLHQKYKKVIEDLGSS